MEPQFLVEEIVDVPARGKVGIVVALTEDANLVEGDFVSLVRNNQLETAKLTFVEQVPPCTSTVPRFGIIVDNARSLMPGDAIALSTS